MRAFVLFAFALAACSPSGDSTPSLHTSEIGPRDGESCPEGQALFYQSPGCGNAAPTPVCYWDGPTDACAPSICDCEGKTQIAQCDHGVWQAPWAHRGSCEEGDAATDATDATVDVSPD